MSRLHRPVACAALGILLAAGCQPKKDPFGGRPTEARPSRAPRGGVKGELTRVRGVRVLRLWGSPREQGYAHGYLLADEVRDVIDGFVAVALLKQGRGAFDRLAEEFGRASVPEACAGEMRGLVEGMRAALGGEARSKVLSRAVDYELILVANSLLDWACSSFAAWGEKTGTGDLIAGRNCDYPVTPVVLSTQLVIVREGSGARLGWMNVSVPGLVGATTAVNERGLAFFIHDSNGLNRAVKEGLVPRAFALRVLAEELSGDGVVERARDVLGGIPTWRGSNFLIGGPAGRGGPSAAVIEYDGGLKGRDGHATLRAGAEWICCTNHYRTRLPPENCPRYRKLAEALTRASGMDMERAKETIMLAGVSITVHTIVYDAGARELLLSTGRTVGVGAHHGPFARLSLDELFGRGN